MNTIWRSAVQLNAYINNAYYALQSFKRVDLKLCILTTEYKLNEQFF